MARGFNEVAKSLKHASVDPKVRTVLLDLYLMVEENTQQIHQCAEATLALARSLEQMASLHEATQGLIVGMRGRFDELANMGRTPGVDVSSVPIVDEKGE